MAKKVNSFRLDGKVAWVTGAAGWLGSEMVSELLAAGATVYASGRTLTTLTALKEKFKSDALHVLRCDVTSDHSIEKAVAKIRAGQGKLDVLVNNAYQAEANLLEKTTRKEFNDAYNSSVSSAFIVVQKSLKLLEKSERASVINIASMYGVVSPDPRIYKNEIQRNPVFYGAAKAGLIQLSKYLAVHLADRSIRVNAISPGPFPNESVVKKQPEFHRKLRSKVPLNRIGSPRELANAVVFLGSDAASYITGANLSVDGGWTAW
jgi:NAD(P)-dependent dehydrogenase (short-subunit alcohol dehydrogenase family)